MKELIPNNMEVNEKKDELLQKAKNLRDAGFFVPAKETLATAHGFIAISPEQIEDFLKSLCCRQAGKKLKGKFYLNRFKDGEIWCAYNGFIRYMLFQWCETPVENYMSCPPSYVVERIQKAKSKNIFDEFVVCEIKDNPDPIVVGRINGSNKRFFIAQWDEDIKLDDLI